MKHELKYDDENDIAILSFKSHFLFSDVEPIFSQLKVMFENKPYRQVMIITNESYNIENRETREAISNELAKQLVTEVALIGLNAATRMIAKVIFKTGKIKLKGEFFKSFEEALQWLKSNR
jgi:hypothetical protein